MKSVTVRALTFMVALAILFSACSADRPKATQAASTAAADRDLAVVRSALPQADDVGRRGWMQVSSPRESTDEFCPAVPRASVANPPRASANAVYRGSESKAGHVAQAASVRVHAFADDQQASDWLDAARNVAERCSGTSLDWGGGYTVVQQPPSSAPPMAIDDSFAVTAVMSFNGLPLKGNWETIVARDGRFTIETASDTLSRSELLLINTSGDLPPD